MNITQINELTVDSCKAVLLERLEVESAEASELEAELELYKAELIAEVERIADLKSRFAAMPDSGLIQAYGIQNPALYFNKEILKMEPEAAEAEMSAIEAYYAQRMQSINNPPYTELRAAEYAKIDKMLMEAIAEKEAGRPEKMDEYLALREQIKLDIPKE